ncbi:MAG: tripartite tricarboxylate transporter substrate binding protein [Alphaproteobacteria bacterium]|nr:tripartite tricarboxylate transporter substrate binding protein [Alphaproteobacteria bacterium]
MFRRSLAGMAAIAVAAWFCGSAAAQGFPSKQITIIVGLAPGGITDVTARIYADALSKSIGQRVVVENRAGAGGAIGAAAVQNAPPDGHTVLIFSGSQHMAVPAIQATAPYEPIKGFAPVSLLFHIATLIAVPTELPAKDLAGLWAYGKKKPGGLSFGSPGVGTPSHLMAARLAKASGTPMQYVHYRGGGPMMADLITGRVDFALSSFTAAKGQFQEKKLRALAIDAPKRWDAMADVPTLSELGYKDKVASWFGVAAPAGTPPEIVKRLSEEFVKASRDPALVKRLADNGTPIETTTPEQMAKLMAEEWRATVALVKDLDLKQK